MKFNRSKELCLIAALAAGALPAASAWSQEAIAKADDVAALLPQSIKDSGALRIAVPDTGKPLAYKEGGELKGMDVDLAQSVAAVLGLKADISLIPFATALTGLQSNKFDISYGEFYVTTERLKIADFVTNWQDYSTFLVKKNQPFQAKTLADICGHKVGAMAGSAELATLKSASSKCTDKAPAISAFPSINNAVLALNSGRVDGVLINRGGAQESIRVDAGLNASGEIGGGPTATAVARNANSGQLLQALKGAYDRLIQNGEYAKILDKNDTAFGAVKSAEIYREGSTPPKYSF
ncbi:transporter substrate-binding domain-containing protein [Sodalis sp. RH21]|uniref:transporter substrate-binding domain-containing protein n=1 Tax=unclassified Sodalis (in: enterobacteria) TaxID=2636512 RepID=UPI0039B4A56E